MNIQKDLENLPRQLAIKWVSVPFAITTVLFAGASYNLLAYFQQIGKAQGYGSETMTVIKYTVLFGFYLGLLPGFIVRTFTPTWAFIFAAIASLISFSTLGYIAENGQGEAYIWILMMFMLFIGAMSGALATVGAIVTSVKNFPRVVGMLIVVLMIPYYKVAPYFEFSIRSAFFAEMSLLWYFIMVGVSMAVVFLAAAFAIRRATINDKIENVMADLDRMAMLIFVFIEVIFLAAYYVMSIILEDWFVGAILFLVFIFLNFLALALSTFLITSRAKKFGPSDLAKAKADDFKETNFGDYIKEVRYMALIVATFIVVGTGITFNFNISQICFSVGAVDSFDNILDTFFIADLSARIIGGLLAYFTDKSVNEYLFAAVGGLLSAIGFGCALLAEPLGPGFLFAAAVLIGIGVGLFWVIVPMIVMDDAGPHNFGLNWGMALFTSVFGMLFYGEFFDLWYDYQGGGDKCKGLN